MKRFFLSALGMIGFTLSLLSCNDPVTGSKSLTEQITGNYGRAFEDDHGSYIGYTKDSIYITEKDNGFEVRNVRRYKSVNKDGHFDTDISGKIDTAFTRVPGFGTYAGTFNKIDTTISQAYGSSIKLVPEKGLLYFVNKPDKVYKKKLN